ncbi:MAG: hypothetical protein FWH25_00845 [Syntrophorhabdaceae bacterium]|nr:hypothetical protein [Syntrophorhabdaceae bacterium]
MFVYGADNVSGTTTKTIDQNAGASAQGLQHQFLSLLVTQLQNQDPLEPMDSVNFTSQLAQFSSLEQLTQLNSGFQALIAAQNSMQNAYLANLIGKEVFYESSASMFGPTEMLQGIVTGISYDSDGTRFIINGDKKVGIGEIIQVNQPSL